METRIDPFAPRPGAALPLGSWQAAARWNQVMLEWMTQGWQQWLQMLSAWPASTPVRDATINTVGALQDIVPTLADQPQARGARRQGAGSAPRASDARRTTRAPKAAGAKRSARPQAAASRSPQRTRSKG